METLLYKLGDWFLILFGIVITLITTLGGWLGKIIMARIKTLEAGQERMDKDHQDLKEIVGEKVTLTQLNSAVGTHDTGMREYVNQKVDATVGPLEEKIKNLDKKFEDHKQENREDHNKLGVTMDKAVDLITKIKENQSVLVERLKNHTEKGD